MTSAVVQWIGSGMWTVDNICFDWDNETNPVWICYGDGSELTAFYSLTLTCEEQSILSCPTTSTLPALNKIVVNTATCVACSSDESITLSLTGLQEDFKCNTDRLNHPDKLDFSTGQSGEFFTEADDQVEDGWGNCYEVTEKDILY